MKTKIIIIAMIALAAGACKTVKQSQSSVLKSATDVTVNQSSEKSNDIKLTVDSSKLTIDKGNVSETITEENTTVVYAPVDSTGKQAIVSVTTQNRYVVRNEHKNINENKQISLQLRDRSDSKSDSTAVDKSKIKETRHAASLQVTNTPGWVYVLIMVIAGIVLGFVYLILKRYNIIK